MSLVAELKCFYCLKIRQFLLVALTWYVTFDISEFIIRQTRVTGSYLRPARVWTFGALTWTQFGPCIEPAPLWEFPFLFFFLIWQEFKRSKLAAPAG